MSSLVYRIHELLSRIVKEVRVGTNLDLYYLIWMLMSGQLLENRGAVIPGLSAFGLSEEAVRRSAAALVYGVWEIEPLVESFRAEVEAEGRWEAHGHGGVRPVAADLVGFSRPKLSACPTKHYSAMANQALPAIVVGIAGAVGSVEDQRLAVPRVIVESDPEDPSELALMKRLLSGVNAGLSLEEVIVTHRGVPLLYLLELGIKRYVKREKENFTARHADLHYKGRGIHPKNGEIVRPLPRMYRGRVIEATPPDREERWQETTVRGRTVWVRAAYWDNLVLEGQEAVFRCVVIGDPRYRHPLVLVTPLDLGATELRALYEDRWPIERVPLVAKQVLGVHRQFVSTEQSRTRLPMVALLSGAILSYLSTTELPVAAGYRDRSPRPTAGRLRRLLARVHDQGLPLPTRKLRKKQSPTAHLLKGILAHRRRKTAPDPAQHPTPDALPLAA